MRTAKTLIKLADAQADLSLRRVHMPGCWFCRAAAYFSIACFVPIAFQSTRQHAKFLMKNYNKGNCHHEIHLS